MVRPRVFLDEVKHFEPELYKSAERAFYANKSEGHCFYPAIEDFMGIKQISVDCAVMERSKKTYACDMQTSWNDVGTWPQFLRLKMRSVLHKQGSSHRKAS